MDYRRRFELEQEPEESMLKIVLSGTTMGVAIYLLICLMFCL